MNVKKLINIKPNETVTIKNLNFYENLKNQFYQLGIIEGAQITKPYNLKVSKASLYEMCGRLFSIRDKDADKIDVV